MPITSDTKDWTWVLERRCAKCGFDTRDFPREQIGQMIRANAAGWEAVIDHPDVTRRPSGDVWSALEYACHVRDVFDLYHARLEMMLEQDDPQYPNWDQDAAAIDGNYSEQDPARVLKGLEGAAEGLASRFDEVHGDQWNRTGTRSDGVSFTIESFGRYLIHDPIHHLHDVERGFARVQESR